MTQRKRHSPTERILPRGSFNFPTWPTCDERYFRSLMAAGCFTGGAEIRFGNTGRVGNLSKIWKIETRRYLCVNCKLFRLLFNRRGRIFLQRSTIFSTGNIERRNYNIFSRNSRRIEYNRRVSLFRAEKISRRFSIPYRRPFKFYARRHREKRNPVSCIANSRRAWQRPSPSFLTDGEREISRCDTPLSSKPINLRLHWDDLGPYSSLSVFSLSLSQLLILPNQRLNL